MMDSPVALPTSGSALQPVRADVASVQSLRAGSTDPAGRAPSRIRWYKPRGVLGASTRRPVVASAAPQDWQQGQMSTPVATAQRAWSAGYSRIESHCKGTGDLFAANLTALLLAGLDLPQAARRSAGVVLDVLEHTHAANCNGMVMKFLYAVALAPWRMIATHAR